jgi:CLIP-associating protein 1/2
MSNLDATAQKLLQNDPNNPNSPKKPEVAARPGLGMSKSTLGPGKPSLRETVVAQRKAVLAAKNLPARPGSAMAHFSPARTVSNSSTLSNSSTTTTASTVRKRPDLATAPNAGGLSVAPMRPARRRPELAARPATAGPYSVRVHDEPSSEKASPPEAIRPRPAVTPKPHVVSPKRTVQRPRQGHVASASESSVPTPSRATYSKTSIPSPRGSAGQMVSGATRHFEHHSPGVARPRLGLSPAAPIVADVKTVSPKDVLAPAASVQRQSVEPDPETTARPLKVFEDPFTEEPSTPRSAAVITPVLEDRPVNTDFVNLRQSDGDGQQSPPFSPEKTRQNSRLLDSGISKVKAQSLEVHGFRKLQSILRDPKVALPTDKFDALLLGLCPT